MSELPRQPLVSIDTVPLVFDGSRVLVVLARRLYEPFQDEFALPGVLLLPSERLTEAALRALSAKAGVDAGEILSLTGAGVFDNPDRDPRGPTLSIVHAAVLRAGWQPPAERVRALPLNRLGPLPFDHEAIIRRTTATVLDALWVDRDLTRALLGDAFTTAHAAQLVRELSACAGRGEPDTSNLGRSLAKNTWFARSAIPAPARGAGRPPASWSWA